MKMRLLAALVMALTIGTAPAVWAAAAEGSGSLAVSIKDNYGALPGATVRLVSKDGQSTARAVADGSGIARFSSLSAGEYTIKASLVSFADGEKGVNVGATEEKVELVLTLARFSTSITVTTANRREELLLNTAEPTTVIDQVQILDTGARNAKDGFRAPYFGEPFLLTFGFQGNPLLKPESSETITGGWAYIGSKFEDALNQPRFGHETPSP